MELLAAYKPLRGERGGDFFHPGGLIEPLLKEVNGPERSVQSVSGGVRGGIDLRSWNIYADLSGLRPENPIGKFKSKRLPVFDDGPLPE